MILGLLIEVVPGALEDPEGFPLLFTMLGGTTLKI